MLNITRALRNKKKKNDRRSASAVEPMVIQPSPMTVQPAVRTPSLVWVHVGRRGVAGNSNMFAGMAQNDDKDVKCFAPYTK